ncbi:hypothetical protein [Maridesulfovibrio sp. FT414]|uniref:hypothetical protein n=1 Tax=Maridesulfovibrio sp. FT414 TaxID=2979469 RepID=UPI003D8029F8
MFEAVSVKEVELLTLAGGIGVLGFVFWNRTVLRLVPDSGLLLASYCCFLLAWTFTVVESLVFGDILNLCEHAMYALGSILLCWWCCSTAAIRGGGSE